MRRHVGVRAAESAPKGEHSRCRGSPNIRRQKCRLRIRARSRHTWRSGRTGHARKGRPSKLGDPDYSSMEESPVVRRAGNQSPTGARKQVPARSGQEQAPAQEVG